jgi:hypothetical protein
MPTEVTAKAPTPAAGSVAANLPGQGVNPNSGDPSKATNAAKVINAPFTITTHHERSKWLKILFYAKHGAGKTELAATAVDAPQLRDILYINSDKGGATIDDSPRIQNKSKLYNVDITSFKQAAYVQEFLTAYCKARDAGNITKMRELYARVAGPAALELDDDEVPRFRTVIVDTLTELEVYCLYGIMNIDSQKVVTDDIEVADWPVFRKNNEMVKLLARAFRDLPMHVIFVCQEIYVQDEMKRMHYSPGLTGKLSTQIQGFVDIVGRIVVGQATADQPIAPRRVYVQPISGGATFDAKNRKSNYTSAYFDNPSMTSILKDIGMYIPDKKG